MRKVVVWLAFSLLMLGAGCKQDKWSGSEMGFDGSLWIDGEPFVYLAFSDYFAVMAAPDGNHRPMPTPLTFYAVSDVFPQFDGVNFRSEELLIFQLHPSWFDTEGHFLEINPMGDWEDWLFHHAGATLFYDTHQTIPQPFTLFERMTAKLGEPETVYETGGTYYHSWFVDGGPLTEPTIRLTWRSNDDTFHAFNGRENPTTAVFLDRRMADVWFDSEFNLIEIDPVTQMETANWLLAYPNSLTLTD